MEQQTTFQPDNEQNNDTLKRQSK